MSDSVGVTRPESTRGNAPDGQNVFGNAVEGDENSMEDFLLSIFQAFLEILPEMLDVAVSFFTGSRGSYRGRQF